MDAQEVVAARESLGMDRTEFARALDVDFSTVWRWEKGARPVGKPYVRLIKILQATAQPLPA